jgi:hypothetical protein
MSIKMNQIELRTTHDVDGSSLYEAYIVIKTERTVSAIEKTMISNPRVALEEITDQMKAALMNHIYGDLVGPINELAILAQHHLTGMNDADELLELKSTIDNIIKGY